ncbi:hypothetical protein, partial [Oceanisphaera ostreae]
TVLSVRSNLDQIERKLIMRRPCPPNPQELIKAILVDFEAKLGDKASETAANINPMAAALMSGSGNKFTFKIENGETTMNGERL